MDVEFECKLAMSRKINARNVKVVILNVTLVKNPRNWQSQCALCNGSGVVKIVPLVKVIKT
jgi:hypothetical protein